MEPSGITPYSHRNSYVHTVHTAVEIRAKAMRGL
jgi:hypothetical protein